MKRNSGNDQASAPDSQGEQSVETPRRKRSRWGEAPSSQNTAGIPASSPSTAKATELKNNIAKRLAALKDKRSGRTETSKTSSVHRGVFFQDKLPPDCLSQDIVDKKAKVYDLNFSQVKPTFKSEEGLTAKPTPVNPYLAHESAASKDEVKLVESEEVLLDSRLAGGHTAKSRVRSKALTFVEPGTFVKIAERKREKAVLAAKAGFASGRKDGTYLKVSGIAEGLDDDVQGQHGAGIYGATQRIQSLAVDCAMVPRIDEDPSSVHGPVAVEWWDAPFLPSNLKNEIAQTEKNSLAKKMGRKRGGIDVARVTTAIVCKKPIQLDGKAGATSSQEDSGGNDEKKMDLGTGEETLFFSDCFAAASLNFAKTSKLVQHPVAIETPQSMMLNPTPTLYLTKQEMKRQRKLRRAEKQREQQDLQAAGLVPAPEARLTLSNFIKVLGNQAVTDPSRLEQMAVNQIQARQIKHEQMNEERKLSKEMRSEKRYKKFHDNTSNTGLHVALFFVKDMAHRYHRTKVDLNAQQNGITGGVLECGVPKMALVIAEGGPKAIKRYIRLMTVRMNWRGESFSAGDEIDGGDEIGHSARDDVPVEGNREGFTEHSNEFNSSNYCDLVWTGMSNKRTFTTFVFQSCTNSDSARKVLESKGVAHFWDQTILYSKTAGSFKAVSQLKT
jgi:U4/U6 small nuclear ribonucleoprotein PRP3